METNKGMGGHQSTKMLNDEWLTPPEMIEELGQFDLDPCSPINRPWDTAKKHYTLEDNGLLMPWEGFVWMNPPYGRSAGDWMNRLVMHGEGIALIFARTETDMFFRYVWEQAHSVLFIKGRISFYTVDGEKAPNNGGAPSVLVAYGEEASKRLEHCSIKGKFVNLK